MSLIEEALRQVQDTAPPTPQRRAPAPPGRPAPTLTDPLSRPRPSRQESNSAVAVMASLALVGLLSIAWLAGSRWRARMPDGESAVPSAASIVPSTTLPTTPSRLPKGVSAVPGFVLSGIMEQEGERTAVVNNTIVQAGDMVDGATVLEVRRDSVSLRWKTQDVILKTTR